MKAGGGFKRVDLDDAAVITPDRSDELLAVDGALDRLATIEPQAAQLVQLRYFAGCTMNEAASQLNISLQGATVSGLMQGPGCSRNFAPNNFHRFLARFAREFRHEFDELGGFLR